MLDGFYIVLSIYLVKGLAACIQGDRRIDAPEAGSNTSSADGLSSFTLA
jgi:hypothetical protein